MREPVGIQVNYEQAINAGHDIGIDSKIFNTYKALIDEFVLEDENSYLRSLVLHCNVRPASSHEKQPYLLDGSVMELDPKTPAHMVTKLGSLSAVCKYKVEPPTGEEARAEAISRYNEVILRMQRGDLPNIRHERKKFYSGPYEGEDKLGWLQPLAMAQPKSADANVEVLSDESGSGETELVWTPSLGRGDVTVHLEETDEPVDEDDEMGGTKLQWYLIFRGCDWGTEQVLHRYVGKNMTLEQLLQDNAYTQAKNLITDNFDILAWYVLKEAKLNLSPKHIIQNKARGGYSLVQGDKIFNSCFYKKTSSHPDFKGKESVVVYRDAYNTCQLVHKDSVVVFQGLLPGYVKLPMPNLATGSWTNRYLDSFPASACIHEKNLRTYFEIQSDPKLREKLKRVHSYSDVNYNPFFTHPVKVDLRRESWPEFGYNPKTIPIPWRTRSVMVTAPHVSKVNLEIALQMSRDAGENDEVVLPIVSDVITEIQKHYKKLAVHPKVVAAHLDVSVVVEGEKRVPYTGLFVNQPQASLHYVSVKKITLEALFVLLKSN